MSESNAKPLALLPCSEDEKLYAWRKERFLALGFSGVASGALARKQVDHHKVNRVLTAGCPIETAVRIFL